MLLDPLQNLMNKQVCNGIMVYPIQNPITHFKVATSGIVEETEVPGETDIKLRQTN